MQLVLIVRAGPSPSSKLQMQPSFAGRMPSSVTPMRWSRGTEIGFALAVALAEFQQPAAAVDAQPLDRVARPAAAVARGRQPLLGRQHAVGAGFDVAAEVGLAAEQAEAVLHLPFDPGRRRARRGQRPRRMPRQRRDQGQE